MWLLFFFFSFFVFFVLCIRLHNSNNNTTIAKLRLCIYSRYKLKSLMTRQQQIKSNWMKLFLALNRIVLFFGALSITSEHPVLIVVCTAIMWTMPTAMALNVSVRSSSHISTTRKLRQLAVALISRSQHSGHHSRQSSSSRRYGSLVGRGAIVINTATPQNLKTPQHVVARAQTLTMLHSQGMCSV